MRQVALARSVTLRHLGGVDEKIERERRLAEALRANLRRRKAQARALDSDTATEATAVPDGDGPPPQ